MKLDEKGAVPIPYIVALVLGVVVIALVSYWLFMSGGEFGKAVTESSCQAKKLAYCNTWKLEGLPPSPGVFSGDCTLTRANPTEYYAPTCCLLRWAWDDLDEIECEISTTLPP